MSASAEAGAPNVAATNESKDDNNGGAPQQQQQQQSSSSLLLVPKVSVVTPQRKEELLLKARVERRQWIEKVPLPYDPECYQLMGRSTTSAAASNASVGTPGIDLWKCSGTSSTSGPNKNNNNSLYKLQSSHVCQKYLPSATAAISELYGLPTTTTTKKSNPSSSSAVEDDVEPAVTRPLNLTQVTERVGALVSPYLDDKEADDESSPPEKDTTGGDADATTTTKESSNTGNSKPTLHITSDPAVLQAYHDLWTSLMWPESSVLVQGMRNFLFNWTHNHFNTDDDKTPSLSSAAMALKSYCKSTVDSLVKSNKNLVGTSEDTSRLRRSLESFVFGQVRDVIRKAIVKSLEISTGEKNARGDDSEHATTMMSPFQFEERLVELQFVQPSHLEIACLQDDIATTSEDSELQQLLKDPIHALVSVDAYHSPFEKLQQILLVYQGVNKALSEALNKGNNNGPKVLPSADDVLPTIILVCIKAQPRNLLQNLQCIEQFAAPEYLRGEAGYAFTNLYGAVQFLQDLDLKGSDQSGSSSSNQLFISPEDLKKGLEKYRKQRDELLASKTAVMSLNDMSNPFLDGKGLPKLPPTVKLSVQEVHSAHLRGETVDLEWALERQQQIQPQEAPTISNSSSSSTGVALPEGFKRSYTFLNAQPSDIRVTDLSKLLEEYHMLVQVTEDLLAERSARITAERKQRELEQQQALGERLLLGDP